MAFKRSAGLKLPMEYVWEAKIKLVDEAEFRRAFLHSPYLGKAKSYVTASEMHFFYKLTTDLQRQRFGMIELKKSGVLEDISTRWRLLSDTVQRLEEIQHRTRGKADTRGPWTKDASRNILSALKPIEKRFRNLLLLDHKEMYGHLSMAAASIKRMNYKLIGTLEFGINSRFKLPLSKRGRYLNAVIASILFATKSRTFSGVIAADLSRIRGIRHQAHAQWGKEKWKRDITRVPEPTKTRYAWDD
jgi:hypothetical protein